MWEDLLPVVVVAWVGVVGSDGGASLLYQCEAKGGLEKEIVWLEMRQLDTFGVIGC